jgi:3',5'-cyclic AMP phosphodiesterase CpdA
VEFQRGDQVTPAAIRIVATAREFVTELGHSLLYSAVLRGLTPNTRYAYRVGDGTHWSAVHAFTTADAQANHFKFLLFGDSQSGSAETIYAPWALTLHNAFRANPDARFMINAGDLVEYGQSGAHWNAWFDAAQGVIDTIPQMPIDGNHETYPLIPDLQDRTHKRYLGTFPAFFDAQLRLPQNGPTPVRDQAYSFNYGQVHFVALDSQEEEEGHDILRTQARWLAEDLAASAAPWKIVFFHRTPYDIKLARNNDYVRRVFTPILDQYHVDVVFNGHDHGVARTFPMKGGVCAHKPSEGTVYIVTGRSGNKTYDDLLKKPCNTYFYNPLAQPNYLVVEVNGLALTVRTYLQDGTLIDNYAIVKLNDVNSDMHIPLPNMDVALA